MSMSTTTYCPKSNLTVVLYGTPEGMRKAQEAFDAREAAKEAKRAAITPEEREERERKRERELDRKRAEQKAAEDADWALWKAAGLM